MGVQSRMTGRLADFCLRTALLAKNSPFARLGLIPKTWHIHRNTPHGEADFYPFLAILDNIALTVMKQQE